MSTNKEQMRLLRALSDIELYQQAIDFLNAEVEINRQVERRPPLPNTQIHGLLNVAQANTYSELMGFIRHQHSGRTWQKKNVHIKIFYEDLEQAIKELPEFAKNEGLIAEGLSVEQNGEEVQKISQLLACEFIQHLAAENLVRERERSDEEKKEKEEKS
jgi:hypothetical protein